ncbi:hypothetical protein ICF26_001601 [Campylobacter jejuni]|nr:hypothetical protein [Campylobacter jejuni]EGF5817728.1 hypothetical protein [Campylobacter jejuni]
MKILIVMILCLLEIKAGEITNKQFEYLSELAYTLKLIDFCLNTSKAMEFLKRDNFKFLRIEINAGVYSFKGSVYELNKICEKAKI